MKTWYVYIVECKDKTFYTGITNDLNKRIEKHNNKKGAKYTRGRTPVILRAYFEVLDMRKALSMEHKIKKLTRAQKIELINYESKRNTST